MSSHSSESESGQEEAVGEDLKGQEEEVIVGSKVAAGSSRILELLQEERQNDSSNEQMNNGVMSQGYRKIQQMTEDMSEDSSSVATPRVAAFANSPDGSVVSFQDDTPSVQVGITNVSYVYTVLTLC